MFLFCHSWRLLLYNVCCFIPSAVAKSRLGTTSDLIWTILTWYNLWMVSFVDTICYVSKIIWQKKKINDTWKFWYWLFINVIIRAWFYCLLENWTKFSRILAHPATCSLRLDFEAVTSKLSKKQNVMSQTTIFKVLLQ